MVFTSLPAAYFDPSNWQQQPNQQQTGGAIVTASSQLLPPALPPPPPPPPPPHGSGGAGSIRPGSMADRARLANIPMPETSQKCPRCESTNTKFCYFNNYSLTQPRHFCKTCRRYWTRGGALRNVPVGGGCRRNKRSKSGSSKSPVSGERPTGSGSTATVSSNSTGSHDILGLGAPQLPSLRFMAPLHHHLSDFADLGFGYNSITAPIGANDLNFQIGNALASAGGSLMSVGGLEQWRLQQQQQHQFPFFGGLDSSNSSSQSSGLYPTFDHGSMEGSGFGLVRPKLSSPGATQLASVKMEESQELHLSRQFLGNMNIPSGNENHYWNNAGNNGTTSNNSAWTDLSSFSSSSTTNNPM